MWRVKIRVGGRSEVVSPGRYGTGSASDSLPTLTTFRSLKGFPNKTRKGKGRLHVKKRLFFLAYVSLVLAQIVALGFAFERPARAYVDPGSGLLAFQIAGSMIAGVAYYLRARIARLFSRGNAQAESENLRETHVAGKSL